VGTVEHLRTDLHRFLIIDPTETRYIEQLKEPTAEVANGQGFYAFWHNKSLGLGTWSVQKMDRIHLPT